MGKMTTLLLSVLLISMVNITTPSQRDSFSFYYHSIEQQAIIFEDLDDSTEEIVELTNADYIYGPGFSPSANWFAYAAGDSNLSALHVFSVIGNERINVGQTIGLDGGVFSEINWSMNTEMLVFAYTIPRDDITQIFLFYPESRSFVGFDSQTAVGGYDHIYELDWLPDDTGIAVYHRSVIEIFDISGEPINMVEANLNSSRSPVCGQNTPNNVVNDRLTYIDRDTNELVIYQIETEYIISSVEMISELDMAFWSSDGLFALLFFARPQTTVLREYDVWLYSVTENSLKQINTEQSIRTPSYCDGRFSVSLWYDHFAVLATSQDNLLLIDADAANVLSIDPDTTGRLNSSAPIIWSSASAAVNFVWFNEEFEHFIYNYNIGSDNLSLVAPVDIENFNLIRFFALNENGLVAYNNDGNLVIDSTEGNQILSPTIEYPADGVYGVENFTWHPYENWLMVSSPFAGTSVVGRLTLINLEDGSQQFLTDCPINESACFGWLSE